MSGEVGGGDTKFHETKSKITGGLNWKRQNVVGLVEIKPGVQFIGMKQEKKSS